MPGIDQAEASRHFDLLRRDMKQTIYQTWPDKETRRGFASTGTNHKKLREGVEAGGNAGFALAKFHPGTLNGHAKRSVAFIQEKGGFYDVLAAEWDDGSSLEEQREIIREANLPDPSISVFTGNKSHHHYWLLDEQITMVVFCDLQARLAQGLGSDPSITTGDQVLRIAGFPHSSTGQLARIVFPAEGQEADRYSVDEFTDLPELIVHEPVRPKATASDLTAAIKEHLFPVAEKFSNYSDWIKTGMAFHAIDEGNLALWVEFCKGMDSFDEGECLEKWQTFSNKEGGITSGSLYYWLAREGWRGGEDIKVQHPIGTRIELLQAGLLEITRTVTSAWKRRAHAEDLNEALGKPTKGGSLDAALAEAIGSVRAERSTTPRRADSWESFKTEADESATVDWIVHGMIAKGDSHLLVAPAKEGKTSALAAFLMQAFIGQFSVGGESPGSIIWFSDDQARGKTQSYVLAAAKGANPDGQALLRERFEAGHLIVDDRFDMTADGIEELITEVRKAHKPVVVVDSLASVCRKLGLKENDSSFATAIYDMGEAVKEANPEATLIIIHHSKKGGTKDQGSLESVRGSSAIPGAVDNVITISKPLKTSRSGNSAVADDQAVERIITVNGRVKGGTYYADIEFNDIDTVDPRRPGKVVEKLDTITATWKAESTYQDGSEEPVGSFQKQVLDYLQDGAEHEWTTKLIAVDLDKDPGQISRVLKKLVSLGKVVKRPQGREVLYQATSAKSSEKSCIEQNPINHVNR